MIRDERDRDIFLLKQMAASGGSAQVGSHIDDCPYRRMQKQGWLTRYKNSVGETVYEVTEIGRKILSG
jgi:hypothetical protein